VLKAYPVSDSALSEPKTLSYTYVYISRAQISGDVTRELARIEVQARARNNAQGIRGALVYMGGFFMQWLEGPQEAITALAARLRTDSRHRDFYELLAAPQPPVLAEQWTMCVAKRTETQEELLRRARSIVVRARKGGWTAADLVRRLVKPSDMQAPQAKQGVFRYSRVCVVATNSIWPSALIRHVADTAKISRISRTWFNQLKSADESALCEYVDVPVLRGTHMRVSCMSGWLVPSPLFDLLNQNVQVLAMLFRSASVGATLEYAQNILGTRSMQRGRPIVIGVFSHKSGDISKVFQEYAEQQGFQVKVVYSHLAEPTSVWEEILAAADEFFIEHEWLSVSTQLSNTVFGVRSRAATAAPVAAAPVAPPALPQPPEPTAPAQPPRIETDAEVFISAATDAASVDPAAAQEPQHALKVLAQQILSAHAAVHDWKVWPVQELAQLADAPAPLLQALDALRSKLAAGEPSEMLSQHSAGQFEWLYFLPHADAGTWLQVQLRDADLNLGMVQYLAAQWKEELARAATFEQAA
jgi:hypothetical protein